MCLHAACSLWRFFHLPGSTSDTSLRPLLQGEDIDFRDEVFMKQGETRAIRSSGWLFMRRIENSCYDFTNELNDLTNDPDEGNNIAADPVYADIME